MGKKIVFNAFVIFLFFQLILVNGCINDTSNINNTVKKNKAKMIAVKEPTENLSIFGLTSHYEPPEELYYSFALTENYLYATKTGKLQAAIYSSDKRRLFHKQYNINNTDYSKVKLYEFDNKSVIGLERAISYSLISNSNTSTGTLCLTFEPIEGKKTNSICSNIKDLPPHHLEENTE